jgi:ribosomal protein S18 acetylase RimI-like enzyme
LRARERTVSAEATLRTVTVGDLAVILQELGDFWQEGRDMGFLHQALYVHEFGETSVLAEEDGRILGYLLGFIAPAGYGYIHAVGVRAEARGRGLGRQMYERFAALAAERGAGSLKAITAPENSDSRAFHLAVGFSEELVEGYSPSGAARIVFRRPLQAQL